MDALEEPHQIWALSERIASQYLVARTGVSDCRLAYLSEYARHWIGPVPQLLPLFLTRSPWWAAPCMITYTTTERPPCIVNPRFFNGLCLAAETNYDLGYLGLQTLGDDDQDLALSRSCVCVINAIVSGMGKS